MGSPVAPNIANRFMDILETEIILNANKQVHTPILEHGSRIKNKIQEAPMVSHFLEAQHTSDDSSFVPRAYEISEITKVLLNLEAKWIFKLKTYHHYGLKL